jgi:hypothetical protein
LAGTGSTLFSTGFFLSDADRKNPPKNYVEAVPSESQNESAPKFCKRIRPKILWRQFPPNLKKNPPQNSVEAVPAKSQQESVENSVEPVPAKF